MFHTIGEENNKLGFAPAHATPRTYEYVVGNRSLLSVFKYTGSCASNDFESSTRCGRSDELQRMTSFFKSLVRDDFNRRLRLPRALLRECDPDFPRNVQLRHSGKKWDVKVEQVKEDGLLRFTRGWSKFAADVGLQRQQFVVFNFDGDFTFDVLVYGKNWCKKKPLFAFEDGDQDEDDEKSDEDDDSDDSYEDEDSDEDDDSDEDEEVSDGEGNPLYFEIQFKQQHRSRVGLPVKFGWASGLKEKECVSLKYGKKEGMIKLEQRENKTEMARGWNEFWTASGMVFGNTYSFEFKPIRNAIQVKEVISICMG